MLKLVGCICIMAASSQIGFSFAQSRIKRLRTMKQLRRMIAELRPMLECSCTLKEIAVKLSQSKDYAGFGFGDVDISAVDIRNEICKGIRTSDMLDSDLADIASELFGRLGATELQGQLLAVDMTLSELDDKIKAEQENHSSKIKLYRSLGVLLGAFIAILLI